MVASSENIQKPRGYNGLERKRQQINGEIKLKGLLTLKKKYFNLNVSFYQGSFLLLGDLPLDQLNIKCSETRITTSQVLDAPKNQ